MSSHVRAIEEQSANAEGLLETQLGGDNTSPFFGTNLSCVEVLGTWACSGEVWISTRREQSVIDNIGVRESPQEL